MSNSLREFLAEATGEVRAEAIAEGREEGRDSLAKTLIESWASMGKDEDTIYGELRQVAKLSGDEAMQYLNKYYKE